MKILERGTKPTNKVYTVRCTHCRTKFEFARHEGKVIYDQREGDFIMIACPVCWSQVTTSV